MKPGDHTTKNSLKLVENDIEKLAVDLLQGLGYQYVYGPDIAFDSETPERNSYEEILLISRLQNAIRKINPSIPLHAQEQALKDVQRIQSPELLVNNEAFHKLLTDGIPVSYQKNGNERGDKVWLIDFNNPENNEFLVVNQFTIIENGNNKRPDVLLFVNGIPLVLLELKNAADEKTTLNSAFRQIETYKAVIPSLFTFNAFSIISDGLEARAGSVSASFSRFMAWKSADGKAEASRLVSQLETLISGMLNKQTLLDLIRHFIVFEKSKKEDPKTGITSVVTVKKLGAYHQYYAVNRAVESTLRAAGYLPTPNPSREGRNRNEEHTSQSLLGEDEHTIKNPHLGDEHTTKNPLLGGKHTPTSPLLGGDLGVGPKHKHPFTRKIIPYNPALTERARQLRNNMTIGEAALWNELKQNKLGFDFDRQRPIGSFIVDFYCKDLMLAIEVDGDSHSSDEAKRYDQSRQEQLEALGVRFLRFDDLKVRNETDKVVEEIKYWIEDQKHNLVGRITSPYYSENDSLPVLSESPESYGVPGVKSQPVGDRKGGVVWHTQGSGKSLSMVFYTGKIVLAMENPTVVVITDRNDLDDQLFDTFAASVQLLRQEPRQVENRQQLKELLKVASGGVIFTTIQKFQPEEGNVYEELSARKNIVVIADEAHRTQYGFKAKNVDEKDEKGNVVGKKTVYGFAKYLRDALPNATYLGFTGTPIENTDVNTPAVFGNYIDVYDIAQAVEDGATVRIFYESRLAKVMLSDEGKKLVEELDDELDQEQLTDTQKAKAKWTQLEALIGSEKRLKNIAQDIVSHFEQRQEVFEGKGMIVTMSRRIAADLYEQIIRLRPEWESANKKKGVLKVVMTSASSDGPRMAQHNTTKEERRMLAERMKDPDDELKLVIVRDMWLTGFDAPSMHTMYIDKPMKGHNLMQAIARVNRVYKDKPGGLIVDYLGIASDLKKALSFYSDAGGKGDPTLQQEQAVEVMLEKLEVVAQMFDRRDSVLIHAMPDDHEAMRFAKGQGGFNYEQYFEADKSKKLSIILAAEDYILGLPDGKKRFINEVAALSKAFAIAIPHEQAIDAKDEIGFFQAVKARLVKFDSSGNGRTDEEIETTIRQVIDQALVSEQVIDVFDAAGIKKPDISILSEEFLLELKGMEHKNVALEVLRKLLNDEIRARAKVNLVESKSLMEMLEESINRYHNKILTAAEVIEELIKIGKDIVKMDSAPKDMGLTNYEYAFYTAVANNESARELMQKDKLRELAVILTERVKENASIDWTIKESVKAKLKVIVKRTLRQFGYPPDMQMLATETVLKQAEMLAEYFVN